MSFALALMAVPACEYGQSGGITVRRATEPSADAPALQQTPAAAQATQSWTASPDAQS